MLKTLCLEGFGPLMRETNFAFSLSSLIQVPVRGPDDDVQLKHSLRTLLQVYHEYNERMDIENDEEEDKDIADFFQVDLIFARPLDFFYTSYLRQHDHYNVGALALQHFEFLELLKN